LDQADGLMPGNSSVPPRLVSAARCVHCAFRLHKLIHGQR
jgi:hypothetical protein